MSWTERSNSSLTSRSNKSARLLRKWVSVLFPVEREYCFFIVLLLIGLCASLLLYWITSQGIGVSPDSTKYIEAAQSFRSGEGFLVQGRPMTHYPPLYSLLLVIGSVLTGNPILSTARLLSAGLFGINLFLFAAASLLCTKSRLFAVGCGVSFFLCSKSILSMHATALSEPTYIMLSMAGMILLAGHIASPHPLRLATAAVLIGFAAITRYIGGILIPAAVISLLLMDGRSLRYRIKDSLILAGIAGGPVACWLIRNILVAQSATDRTIEFHPFNIRHIERLMVRSFDFFLPVPVSNEMKILLAGIVGLLFGLTVVYLFRRINFRQEISTVRAAIPLTFSVYSILYITFLFLSITFFDALTPLTHRILLPVLFVLFLSGSWFVKRVSEIWPRKTIWYGYVLFIVLSISINIGPTTAEVIGIHRNGRGYSSPLLEKFRMHRLFEYDCRRQKQSIPMARM